jgi:DNA helicase-2/ATP-dependent DNA helicase PcrA
VRVEFDRNEHDHKDIEWTTLRNIEVNLKEYKEKNKLRDFNDIIMDVIKLKDTPQFPTFGAVFIDEAQDLSPLQWKLFDVLKEKTKDMYLAGDDDQAIFAWAGADVNRFINEPAQEKVLRYSRRVSKAVLEQSQIIVGRISGIRKHKDYFPRAQEGLASYISNLGQVDLTKGKWLILSRTKNNLLKIMEELRRKGLYYQSNKGKSFKVSIYKAAVAYTSWRSGEKLEAKAIAEIREYTPEGKWDLKKEWYEAFTQASQEDILYIRNLLSNNEKLNEDARIFVSTIHAAKGGEEDNVILSLHQGRKVQAGIALSIDKQDEEHRVWYVGSTRARINLYKLVSKVHRKEYIL